MDRVFLDANVPFSAAYRPDARLRRLWEISDSELITSAFALEEARRNLREGEQRERLGFLAGALAIVSTTPDRPLPPGVELPSKDRPILLAAIGVEASHLLTGDVTHFGRYYGQTVEGMRILPPAEYLRGKSG